MKFDYKPNAPRVGSPILRRTLHVGLGFTAFICLMLALSLGKFADSTAVSIPLEMPNSISPTVNGDTAPGSSQLIQNENSDSPFDNLAANTHPASSAPESQPNTDTPEEEHWQTIKVREGDTLSKVFGRLGIPAQDIHEILTTDPATRRLASLQPGQILKLRTNRNNQIAALTLILSPGNTIEVARVEEGFQVEHKLTPLEKQIAFGKGEIQGSLFSSGKRAGLDARVLNQMVEIFGWNIDFALDLQPNDTFRVLYEAKCLEGERIESGHILAAEIVNSGTTHRAIRYTDKNGHTGYFSPEGYGMHQAFLRAPVNFTRISSHFGKRHHPLLHKMRRHTGVDYSAPHGTPVQATGDGKVIFAGTRGGYGKVIELQHGSRYSTLYAHLSRFSKGIKVGHEIKQGQVIGYVGRTGLATGDHLHYEFRIDGIHRDPLTVALPKRNPIQEGNKRHFIAHAKEMLRLLDIHEHQINMAQIESKSNTQID